MGKFRARGDGMPQIADKAREDNQCIVRGQLIPGPNIVIDKLDATGLHNIRISALFPELAELISRGMVLPRMFHCLVDVLTVPSTGTFAQTRRSLEETSNPGIFFGTAKWIDVVHNWNLEGRMDEYMCTVKDLTRYTGTGGHYASPHSYPKNHAIDKDTIRLHFTDLGVLETTTWRANANTIVGDPLHELGNGLNITANLLYGFPRYFVTIMEKV